MPLLFVLPVETPLVIARTPSDTITTAISTAKKIATRRSLCALLVGGTVRSCLSPGSGVMCLMVGDWPAESGHGHGHGHGHGRQ